MAALTTTSFVSKEAVVVKVGNRITSSSFSNSSSLGFLNTTTTRTTRRTRAVAASFIRCEEEVVVVGGWIGRSSSVGGGVICCWGGSRRTRDHNNNNINSSSSGRRRRRGSISSSSSSVSGGGGVPNSNYVVPLDKSSCITRPLAEILRDLNKKVSDKIVKPGTNCIPWYHANRMLSFFAPGWCGEIRDVIFSDNGNVTVVYRVTIRGFDGEAHRESAGTISTSDSQIEDPVAAAEEIAFCRACARFGLGLHLYHEDETL